MQTVINAIKNNKITISIAGAVFAAIIVASVAIEQARTIEIEVVEED